MAKPKPKSADASRSRADLARARDAIRDLLDALGLDPTDPALASTPDTAARAFAEKLLDGYRVSARDALGRGFPVVGTGPVVAAAVVLPEAVLLAPELLAGADDSKVLSACQRERLCARILEVADGWAGLYEVTPDHNALIGRAGEPDNFLYATGFSGHGLCQAPAVGEIVRDLYLDRTPFADVTPLSADRFMAGAKIRPEAHVV